MTLEFKIIEKNKIETIIPLVFELNEAKVSEDVLKERFFG